MTKRFGAVLEAEVIIGKDTVGQASSLSLLNFLFTAPNPRSKPDRLEACPTDDV
jgi:hypothetical protein